MCKERLHHGIAPNWFPISLTRLPQAIVVVVKAAAFAIRLDLQDGVGVHLVPEGGKDAMGVGGLGHGLETTVADGAEDQDGGEEEAVEGEEGAVP